MFKVDDLGMVPVLDTVEPQQVDHTRHVSYTKQNRKYELFN